MTDVSVSRFHSIFPQVMTCEAQQYAVMKNLSQLINFLICPPNRSGDRGDTLHIVLLSGTSPLSLINDPIHPPFNSFISLIHYNHIFHSNNQMGRLHWLPSLILEMPIISLRLPLHLPLNSLPLFSYLSALYFSKFSKPESPEWFTCAWYRVGQDFAAVAVRPRPAYEGPQQMFTNHARAVKERFA